MAKATAIPNDAIRKVLQSTEMTRDALPYTQEFERLYSDLFQVLGEKLTKQQFWRKISNAAKRGGWKGKNRNEAAPDLTLQQLDVLRSLAAGKLGSRDGLAYSSDFDEFLRRFNQFKMYSGNALARLKEAIPDLDLDEVWREHRARPRKPK